MWLFMHLSAYKKKEMMCHIPPSRTPISPCCQLWQIGLYHLRWKPEGREREKQMGQRHARRTTGGEGGERFCCFVGWSGSILVVQRLNSHPSLFLKRIWTQESRQATGLQCEGRNPWWDDGEWWRREAWVQEEGKKKQDWELAEK